MNRREFVVKSSSATATLCASAAFSPTVLSGAPKAANPSLGTASTLSSVRLVHERRWHIGDADESTHVLGNGRAMIHELGPDIVFFRAPWISSPNLLTMSLIGPAEIKTVSSREEGTNIWHHKLYLGADAVGEIIDFLEDGQPCLRRTISSSVDLVFAVRGPRLVDYSDRYPKWGSLLGQWPYGTRIYLDFLSADPFTVQIIFPKNTQFKSGDEAIAPERFLSRWLDSPRYETRLQVAAGSGELMIAANAGIAECLNVIDRVLAEPKEQSLTKTRNAWRSRAAKLRWTGSREIKDLPIEPVIDDVGTLLLGHQSLAGSIAAGQIYPLFYVRDQYGVSRALLAMNMVDEAKAVLAYYYSIWFTYGRIHNAQSDGPRHWFHRAENDDVEMTGYLIIQAFDYCSATRDDDFIAHIFPMLEWALTAQEEQLRGNMLPFNGDETYVAGGMFPRTHLNDGASEATLIYAASAERLLAWATAHKRWNSEKLLRHQQTLNSVKQGYVRNYVVNGRIAVNNPSRRDSGPAPRFRYGVCLGQYDNRCLFLSTTEVAEDGRYFCYSCYPKRTRQTYEPKTYFIPSVALTSYLAGYRATPPEVLSSTLSEAVAVFSRDGRFAWPETGLPGYETAVVSLALLQQNDSRTEEFIGQMLCLRDATGAWAEYYAGGKPIGCRCRPWESGLSLLALLEYASHARLHGQDRLHQVCPGCSSGAAAGRGQQA